MTTERDRPKRRRHPATGARILVVGLSVSTTLGLMAAMAGPARTEPPVTPPPVSPVPVPVPELAGPWTGAPGVASAPDVAATPAPPVTTSKAS